jgi:hypothetical protein
MWWVFKKFEGAYKIDDAKRFFSKTKCPTHPPTLLPKQRSSSTALVKNTKQGP